MGSKLGIRIDAATGSPVYAAKGALGRCGFVTAVDSNLVVMTDLLLQHYITAQLEQSVLGHVG